MRPLCLLLAFGLCATAQTPADLEAVVTKLRKEMKQQMDREET